MGETPAPDRPRPDIPGREADVAIIGRAILGAIAGVHDERMRKGLQRVWETVAALATVQARSDVLLVDGHAILDNIADANTGHLVAASALLMAKYPTGPDGAVGLYAFAMTYVQHIASHDHG